MKVILASKNQHKLTELSAILSGLGFEIALESEYGLDIDVDETGTTFEENSLLKAEAVMKASGLPVLADDSGLMVDSLKNPRYNHRGIQFQNSHMQFFLRHRHFRLTKTVHARLFRNFQ